MTEPLAEREGACMAWLRFAQAKIGWGHKRRLFGEPSYTPYLYAPMDHARTRATMALLGQIDGQAFIDAYREVSEAHLERTMVWAQEPGNHLLFRPPAITADAIATHTLPYPTKLLVLSDAPWVLYAKGRLSWLDNPGVALVGSRSATAYGERLAEDFAQTLANAGLVVVSGLAQGIDSSAHRGALRAEGAQCGATIGILGTGANIIYPAKNKSLAKEMAHQGLILSEFPLDTEPRPQNFPRRNRLIAAMSLGTLVIEASENSGALITARLAADLGREVFAIPGSVHSPLSRGPHRLLREGAKLVECTADILEELQSALLTYLPPQDINSAPSLIEAVNPSMINAASAMSDEVEKSLEGVEGVNKNEAINAINAPPPKTKKPVSKKSSPSSAQTNSNPKGNSITPTATTAHKPTSAPSSLLNHIPYSPMVLDDLVARTGKTVSEVHGELLDLEMQGSVESLPGGRFQRIK